MRPPISESKKGQGKGTIKSAEHKAKIAQSMKGKNPNSVKVQFVFVTTYEEFSFKTLTDASHSLNVSGPTIKNLF